MEASGVSMKSSTTVIMCTVVRTVDTNKVQMSNQRQCQPFERFKTNGMGGEIKFNFQK